MRPSRFLRLIAGGLVEIPREPAAAGRLLLLVLGWQGCFVYVGEFGWKARVLLEEPIELWGVVEYGERVFALAGLVLIGCGLLGDWFWGKDRVWWMVFLVFAKADNGAAGAIAVRSSGAGRQKTRLLDLLRKLTAWTRAFVFALIFVAYTTKLRLWLYWCSLLFNCGDLSALSIWVCRGRSSRRNSVC